MGKKSSVQWKFRLCFDFDTFLCFQREKPPPHYGGRCFSSPCLASWKFKCSTIVGAGDTEKLEQDLKYSYKRPFMKQI